MISYYEHHAALQKDKFCPFKITKAKHLPFSGECNWHKNIEILFVFDGLGFLQYGKDVLTLEPGDIVVVNSGALHRAYSSYGVGYYVIIIDESFCTENGLDMAQFCFDAHFRDAQTEKLIRRMITQMEQYRASATPLATAGLRAATLELLVDLVSRHTRPCVGICKQSLPSEAYVKKALDYINDHYSDSIELDTLASLCGITKYYLAREFKRLTGQTVFTYVNILRCKKAEALLSQGKSVTEAAMESGFDSLSYFSRTYKKHMGTPPSKGNPPLR